MRRALAAGAAALALLAGAHAHAQAFVFEADAPGFTVTIPGNLVPWIGVDAVVFLAMLLLVGLGKATEFAE